MNLGVAYLRSGMSIQALNAFRQMIRLEPRNAQAHYNVAVAALALGDRAIAMTEYRTLSKLDPGWAAALLGVMEGKSIGVTD